MRRSAAALFLATLLLIVWVFPGAAAAGRIRMFVEGREIAADAAPLIVDGRTLVPVRAVAEALGATVQWNAATKTVTVVGGHAVSLTIGKALAIVDNKPVTLDVAAQIIDGRTFVPVRFLGEAFGFAVAWDAGAQAVKLTRKPATNPGTPTGQSGGSGAATGDPAGAAAGGGAGTGKTCWSRGEPEVIGHTDYPTVYSYSLSGSTLTAINNGTVGTYHDPVTGHNVQNVSNAGPKLTTTLTPVGVPASFCAGDTVSLTLLGGGDGGVFAYADYRIADAGPAVNLLESTKVDSWRYGTPGYILKPGISLQRGKYVHDPSATFTLKIDAGATYADPPVPFRLTMWGTAGTAFQVAVSWVFAPGEVDRVNPVVFIPGVIGSQLMALDGHILWPPGGPGASLLMESVHQDFLKLSLDPATGPHQAVVPTDVIRANGSAQVYGPLLNELAAAGYREYQVGGDLRRRTSAGCDLTQKADKPKLFVFAYDWRMSNADSARALKGYVDCVQRFYPDKKVDIVAHSMGGLVARRYIIDNPGKVNKLITVATPWLGSPKPLYQMIAGTTGTGWSDWGAALVYSADLKAMLAYFPGIHELMTPPSYFAMGGRPYSRQPWAGDETEFVSYNQLMGPGGPVETLFSKPTYTGWRAAQNNSAFHGYSAGGNAQDDWRNDTTGVRYFHIVGVQAATDTPQTLREKHQMQITSQTEFGGQAEETVSYEFAKTGPGDGTVPRISAERKGPNGLNLNAPGAQVLTLVGGAGPYGDDSLLEHTGLVTNPFVMTKVLEFLKAQ
ncbi:MAG TPA: alpha/beta fold hydrolase [Symbiobacteriaceae bacterium]